MEVTLRTCQSVPFYACGGFDPSVCAHGFSTRLGGVSPAPWDSLNLGANRGDEPANVRENFCRFCAALGTDPAALVKNHQIHSNVVRPVTRADRMDDPAVPILLYDPHRRCIAAAHAGWRGTASGIAARAAEKMVADYGCDPAHILAAIGPGIGPCCFETHVDVPEGLRSGLGTDAEDFIRPLPGGEKYQVDLKGANRRWLERTGLLPEHIALCPACTACRLDTFWSHRVQGQRRGSMAAMIQLL